MLICQDERPIFSERRDYFQDEISIKERLLSMALTRYEGIGRERKRVEALRNKIAHTLQGELARLRSALTDLSWELPVEKAPLEVTCEATGSSDVAVQLPPSH